ncbi:heterokaryon incompatibility protein-domain-containing protein, partial [Lophiotrema nucula]
MRPGRSGDEIVCDLCVKKLAEVNERYEALSYCWGDEEPTEIIKIYKLVWKEADQQYSQARVEDFLVRPNLLKALRHLRRESASVVIWIDAICINQRETPEAREEKNRQLSMMTEIYNTAKNVCIWLGDSGDTFGAALDLINDMTNFQTFDQVLINSDKSTQERWCNLVQILKETPWFSRRWIIQEIASARHASVHCGDDVIHWDDLADAVSLLQENYSTLKRHLKDDTFAEVPTLSAIHLVKSLTNVCRKSTSGDIAVKLLDFESLVCTFQQFQAKFPEDILHSVRSLAKDGPEGNEGVALGLTFLTFKEQRSTRDLFITFVRRCISKSGSLDIICRHWAPPVTDTANRKVELPSWISDLSNGPYGLPGESHERQNGENFVALSPNDMRKRYFASSNRRYELRQSRPRIIIPNGNLTEESNRFTSSPTDVSLHQKTIQENLASFTESNSVAEGASPTAPVTRQDRLAPRSVVRHRRSSTISNVRPTPQAIAQDNWMFIFDHSWQPGVMRRQVQNERSRSKLDKWIQDDKEHAHNQNIPDMLEVNGLVLGSIQECSDIMRDGIVPGSWLEKLGWDPSSTTNRVQDKLWRTLIADRTSEGGSPPRWYQRACLHCLRDSRLINANGDLNSHRLHRVTESMTSKYLERVESVIWRRRIIRISAEVDNLTPEVGSAIPEVNRSAPEADTADKFLYGLGPEKTRRGDLVCILFGCSVPVVLRKATQSSSRDSNVFEVVGESYIHGKMDGEAVQNRDMVD